MPLGWPTARACFRGTRQSHPGSAAVASTGMEELEKLLAEARADACIHVREVDGDGEWGHGAEQPVVLASVFKIAILLELARQVAGGERDGAARLRIPADGRCLGPTGLSVMLDEAELSVRDTALLMMSISDNAATDILLDLVGLDRVNATLRELGLQRTRLVGDCASILSDVLADLGVRDAEDWARVAADTSAEAMAALARRVRSSDPSQTTTSTPAETTRLLQLIWRDEAGPPQACAEVRRIMGLQAWGHRLASGFPDGVAVAAKTGTLLLLRNEAAVVTYPDGTRYAVAVFTTAHAWGDRQPEVDRLVGRLARLGVDQLRRARVGL